MVRILIVGGFILSTCLVYAATQGPTEHTRSGQNLYVSQEAKDAVQDEKLKTLEYGRIVTDGKLDSVTDKQNYTLGGIAVLSALFTAQAIIVHRRKP